MSLHTTSNVLALGPEVASIIPASPLTEPPAPAATFPVQTPPVTIEKFDYTRSRADVLATTELTVPQKTSVAIQSTINALPAEGGTVVLPSGTYEVTEAIVIDRDNIELRGQGSGSILRLANKKNAPVIIIGTRETPVTRKVRNIAVSDLVVDGNRESQEFECWGGVCDTGSSFVRNNGITIRAGQDVRIERVAVHNARSGGMVLEKGCRRITVSDFSAFQNFYDGLAVYETEDSLFTRLKVYQNGAAGISLDIKFNHNIISTAIITENGSQGIFMRDSNHNLIQGLQIRRNGAHGVFVAQADKDVNTACRGNIFSNLVVDRSTEGFRINDVSCMDNLLSDSNFLGNYYAGVSLAQEGLLRTSNILTR